jgi:glycosyltransferase involved in cell wall biosynthesis
MEINKSKPEVSVVICAHNPRTDYLERVLNSLKIQSIRIEKWELLLVDNASKEKLSDRWNLSWHPNGRIILEQELGLTAARLRAIVEAKSDLLLFLDDDNEVFPDYLEQGLKISAMWPILGTWGGQWFAEYEGGMPQEWEEDRWSLRFERDIWSNNYDWSAAPLGGGMFVRRNVAKKFVAASSENPLKKLLGRKGGTLAAYEDFEISFCACDMGLGFGRFTALKLVHLIPAFRATKKYFLKLWEDSSYSEILFRFSRGEAIPCPSRVDTIVNNYKNLRARLKGRDICKSVAVDRGKRRAISFLKSQKLI